MSDETGNGVFVLHSVSGCYAEVHISWESFLRLEHHLLAQFAQAHGLGEVGERERAVHEIARIGEVGVVGPVANDDVVLLVIDLEVFQNVPPCPIGRV